MAESSRVRFSEPDAPDTGEVLVPAAQDAPVVEDRTVLVHFVEDGFSAHERVWYRGQELEYERGSAAYQETLDRTGHSWLDDGDAVQMRRYGRVMFRSGPWPGYDYTDDVARDAERKRKRIPPVSSPVPASGPI